MLGMLAIKLNAKSAVGAVAYLALFSVLTGCGAPDRRLVDDQQSCRTMGHLQGTAEFQGCMAELNQRRCSVIPQKAGTMRHVPSKECTQL